MDPRPDLISTAARAAPAPRAGHGDGHVSGSAACVAPASAIATRQACEATGPVSVDWAVFTSIRSPTGEGYRLIAATSAVTADERAELTRTMPSHGSLTSDAPESIGLLSLVLASSGRRAVALVQYAGKEHTARGGLRVHSTIALLDDAQYARFRRNPACAYDALIPNVRGNPLLKPPPRMPPLVLRGSASAAKSILVRPQSDYLTAPETNTVITGLMSVANGTPLLIANAKNEFGLIRAILAGVPALRRSSLAVSAGLKFAPSRPVDLALVRTPRTDAERALRGRPLTILDAAIATRPIESPESTPWLDQVRAHLLNGRVDDLDQLAATQIR